VKRKKRNSPKKRMRPVPAKRFRSSRKPLRRAANAGSKTLFDMMGLDEVSLFAKAKAAPKAAKAESFTSKACLAKIKRDEKKWAKERKADEKKPWAIAEGKRAEKIALLALRSRPWLPAHLEWYPPEMRMAEMKRDMQGGSWNSEVRIEGMGKAAGVEFRWQRKSGGPPKELLRWKDLLDIAMRTLKSKEKPEWMPSVKQHSEDLKKLHKIQDAQQKTWDEAARKDRAASRQNELWAEKQSRVAVRELKRLLRRTPTKSEVAEALEERVKKERKHGIKGYTWTGGDLEQRYGHLIERVLKGEKNIIRTWEKRHKAEMKQLSRKQAKGVK
jgi:hypothetical protein